MHIRFVPLALLLSLLLGLPSQTFAADGVEFVVGDYLSSEGGTWDLKQSPLKMPFGVDFDSQDYMYLVELKTGAVRVISPDGEPVEMRTEHSKGYHGDGGPIATARFNGPHNCVVTQEDQLLISDSWNHCIRTVDLSNSIVETLAGTDKAGFAGDHEPAKSARFNMVMSIALSPDQKRVHIADLKNRRIRDLDLKTGIVTTVAGNGKSGVPKDGSLAVESPLVDPRAVASDAFGNLYVLERNGHSLRVVRSDGTIHTVVGNGKKGNRDGDAKNAQLNAPKHLCCDPDGNVYIADDMNRAIRKYDPKTNTVSTILGRGHGDARITLNRPHGVRWHKGMLYVVDSENNRIMRLKP